MPDFPHLPLPQNVERKNYLGQRNPRKRPQRSFHNLDNRVEHSNTLYTSVANLEKAWTDELETIKDTPLREHIDEKIIPILLKIDNISLIVDALRGFGIEIISQEDEGYIIGASIDAFNKLRLKIDRFANEDNVSTAYLWEIDHGLAWKREMILSAELNEKLDHLSDDEMLDLDISIACNIHVPDKPVQNPDEPNDGYERKLRKWELKARRRDDVYTARYNQFERIVSIYGAIKFAFDYNDSFGCRIEISAKGLKDILFNYPYVFEITEHDYLEGLFEEVPVESDSKVQIAAPDANAPKVCIIDSGIMEGHRLLAPAIDVIKSKSYVLGEGTADLVAGGGHGTSVAGVVLYPNGIEGNGLIRLPFWLQNAKVLNQRNELNISLFPPQLMNDLVNEYLPTRIYNLSINSWVPCRINHMSQWAASIDKLIWENDIIFIISVGNIFKSGANGKPGIRDFLNNGRNYPDYLLSENFCRIANPSQSSFALSVGSVTIGEFEDQDRISFGKQNGGLPGPSPFSRTGLGLWGMIKPDVVELGGDLIREKNRNPNIVEHPDTSPHLVKSVQTSNEATGKDRVGTSFAAPKVSNLVATLQNEFPDMGCLFYRGLVVQSARLPEYAFNNPTTDYLRHFGYGLPSVDRALSNNRQRITLFSNGQLNAKHADIYSVKIPADVNRPGEEFDVLMEVTLSYKANPRRTRMRTNSYLSHWLDWRTSKIGEPFDEFQARIINLSEEAEDSNDEDEEDDPFAEFRYPEMPWKIRERTNLGEIRNVKRQDNTLQKDWLIMKSYNIPDSLGIAVMGHKGWSPDLEEKLPYTLLVSFEALNTELDIYTPIKVSNEIEIEQQIQI